MYINVIHSERGSFMSFLTKLSAFIPLGLLIVAAGMLIVFFINRKSLGLFWKIVLPVGACLIILGVIIVGTIAITILKNATM